MTRSLDLDGPAAPPRSNGELRFEHPWQGRLFATTMAACDAGLINYPEFRERLIAEIGQRVRQQTSTGEYWSAWQDALEAEMADMDVIRSEEIDQRAIEFSEHN